MPPLVCCYLLLCGLLSKAAGLPAYSSQPDPDWNQVPSEDMEDLKLVYDLTRPSRHADGLFTSGYSKLLGQMSAKDYLDSLMAKRTHGDALPAQVHIKRHSDAVFTDNYSRYRKQMAVKKYLHSVLAGRRSAEQPGMTDMSIRAEPTSQQSSPDISLDEILNQLALGL